MKDHFQKQSPSKKSFVYLAGAFMLLFGLVFSMAVQPALASTPAQVATATATATVASGGTATVAATLAPPAVTGTPTALVPVTGADQTQSGEQAAVALRVALGLLGLLLVAYGIRSYRLGKR